MRSAIAVLLIAFATVAAGQVPRPCRAPARVADPAPPLNDPDRFVWQLFVQVNVRAAAQVTFKATDGRTLTTNDALWETWADDPTTFPHDPDPAHPPVWPGGRSAKRVLEKGKGGGHARLPAPLAVPEGGGEEVRRNRATFDYVVQNGLWYQQGIAAFFAGGNPVDFPIDSIEVKANWVPIEETDKPRYHWNYDAEGNLFGLVAMHITSKALPNWIWATFEWAGNAGRCDFIGCRDCFGYTPPIVPSNTKAVGAVYPGGGMTAGLSAMFQAGGLTGAWGAEWRNYRLKGSQTDFTDSAGVPLLVGNSVTEGGFVQTASCMTCHARAAVDRTGASSFPIFGERQPLPLQSLSPLQFQTQFTTYHGTPDPSWFWLFSGREPKKLHMQTDFVWAIPFRARPAKER
ncbi:MAG TPA: hypothetical protein VNA04_11015 [Thermoanaerobaculia bacterium]|nr:hypothetical protein [Thermoanaerobaculia bacterium]